MTNFEIYTYLKSKNGGGGEPVPVPVTNPALRLMDWEGTVLKEYTAEQVATLATLPTPSSLNANVDRELLTFQGYNWSVSDIKAWVTAHEGRCLTVGAIYTTTDGQDHNFWNNTMIFGENMRFAVVQKRGTASIGNNEFQNCTSLENVNIPDSVTSIGGYAFQNCTSLENVNLPDSVASIGNNAFQNCTSLENVNIPDGVPSVGSYAFQYCTSLTSISIPDSVTSIAGYAFQYCTSLTSISILDSVTSIGGYAFQNCTSLENVNLPDSVASIGNNAFQYCTSLENVNIPDGVPSVGSYAFQYCTSLTSISIPDSVTSIGGYAFQNCTSLNGIVVNGKPELSNVNALSGIYSGCLIYVPRANLPWSETATNWATFYAQDKIVAIEDNVDFLRAIGIDV